MGGIQGIIDGMDPKDALVEMTGALKKLFHLLDEEDRMQFVMNLVGESEGDKVSSMVHL